MHPAWPHGEIILTIFGHLLLWNYAQWQQKNPKVSTKIGQIQNKASKNYQIFQEFGQSGGNLAKSGHTAGLPKGSFTRRQRRPFGH